LSPRYGALFEKFTHLNRGEVYYSYSFNKAVEIRPFHKKSSMVSLFTNFYNELWSDIESRLTPFSKESNRWKSIHVLPLLGEVPLGILLTGIKTLYQTATHVARFFLSSNLPDPKQDFSSVLKDPRQWKHLGNIENQIDLGHGNPHFLFGTATCTYQDSGSVHCPDSQWALWETKKVNKRNRSGKSANLFEMYKTKQGRDQIIKRLQELGVNSYRFSLEWSQIEPKEGEYNELNLQVYLNLCKDLRDQGITPMVTLHHFSEPIWFHEKGSFEKEENIDAFIHFAQKVFPLLTQSYRGRPLVEYFCTINEPAIDAFSRFVRGAFSPGLFLNFKRAAHYLKGALKAHCIAYDILKKQAPNVKLGIVHQYLSFIPTNPFLSPITHYLTRLIHEVSLKFFSTGRFSFTMPFVNVTDNTMPLPKTDFVGLQYYVRPVIGMLGPTGNSPMTQMPFCEDPEGLYEAIIKTHKAYKAPVIVTENGISTHKESQRARYLSRALYATQKAQKIIGEENLLGYYLWSFSDNFEWDMGMHPQAFGAFSLDGKLKEGAKIYSKILTTWRETLGEKRAGGFFN